MHNLLRRQLTRIFGTADIEAGPWRELVEAVDDVYEQSDADRHMLERTMELASQELMARNEALQRDITERERLELELQQSQKLEAVGQLASGIAHEINTPIQFVGDSLHFIRDSFEDMRAMLAAHEFDRAQAEASGSCPNTAARLGQELELPDVLEAVPKAFERTIEGLRRVADIVHALKDFAHPDAPERTPADLNAAILTTLAVARNETKYVADVVTELGDVPLVPCHLGSMKQVLINLVVNSAHAIGDVVGQSGERGRIVIRTSVENDTYVISIADTGGGIPEAVRGRLFEPFFTTKPVGRGTGQGLAIARSIVVDKHKGSLTFSSQLGRGTTFYIRLPLNVQSDAGTEEPSTDLRRRLAWQADVGGER